MTRAAVVLRPTGNNVIRTGLITAAFTRGLGRAARGHHERQGRHRRDKILLHDVLLPTAPTIVRELGPTRVREITFI
jgi:hypothetical protein